MLLLSQVAGPVPGTRQQTRKRVCDRMKATIPRIGDDGMTLVEFLEARITEDETRARALANAPDMPRGMVVRHHFRLNVAECAAKRAILATYAAGCDDPSGFFDGWNAAYPDSLRHAIFTPMYAYLPYCTSNCYPQARSMMLPLLWA